MAIDVRVASSAGTDVSAYREKLQAELGATDRQIAGLRQQFRALRTLMIGSQSSWSSSLAGLQTGGSEHAVVTRAEDLLEIFTQLGRIEAKIECATEKRSELEERLTFWRDVPAPEPEVEVRGVPVNRIERQLDHLARREHATIARRIVSGPMQELSDFAVSLEVVERHVEWDPSTAINELKLCRTTLDQAMASMRTELARLRPPRNADECVAQLRSMLAGVAGVEARVDILGDMRLLSDEHAVAVSRIAEKACENALLHGHAERLDIILSMTSRKVSLIIRDDGDGFDVSATNSRMGRTDGSGIISMRERAQHSGGTLEIRSTIDVGTEVRATFPVTRVPQRRGDRAARR